MTALAGRRALPVWPPLRAAAVVVGVLALELVVAVGLVEPRFSKLLLLLLAVGAQALVFRFPFAAACGLMVLVGSINLPTASVPIGPLDARPYELLLGALLVVAIVRPRQRTLGGGWVAGGLVGFIALFVLSNLLALSSGAVTPSDALPWARAFFLYAFFFVIVRLFGDRESLSRLLRVATALAAISGMAAALIAAHTGIGGALDFGGGFQTQTSFGGVGRVRLPGLGLAYGLFWFAFAQAARSHGRACALWSLALAGMSLNIAVSQNRNMWIGLVIGGVLILALGGVQVRRRVLALVGVLAVCGALVASVGFKVDDGSSLEPILTRGTTLFDPKAVGQERSLTHRGEETRRAWEVARKNLLFGIGSGTDFGQTFGEARPDGTTRTATQNFLHNQYLYLLLIGGVPMLLTFLTFLLALLARAVRHPGPTVTPCAIGVAMIMASAVVMLSFSSFEMVSALTLLTGVLTAWMRSETRAGSAAA